jgi:osomolarity two-component system sensor histidine kinase NIK1
MMGDREKCIQAQMDEYLSKPLQQNHLIQTILKCVTLGGPLLEHNRESDLSMQVERKSGRQDEMGLTMMMPPRPMRDTRPPPSRDSLTGTTSPSGSPSSAASSSRDPAATTDPLQRVRNRLSDITRKVSN